MTDPIVSKISELTEMTDDPEESDLLVFVDLSELLSADQTKKIQAKNIKLFYAAQLDDEIVTEAKLATAVSSKLVTNGNSHDHSGGDGGAIPAAGLATDSVETAKIKNSAVTNLKIAVGTISSSRVDFFDGSEIHYGRVLEGGGTAHLPTSWSVTKQGTGYYLITHNMGVTTYNAVVTMNGSAVGYAKTSSLSSNSFYVYTYNTSGTGMDSEFSFIVIQYTGTT